MDTRLKRAFSTLALLIIAVCSGPSLSHAAEGDYFYSWTSGEDILFFVINLSAESAAHGGPAGIFGANHSGLLLHDGFTGAEVIQSTSLCEGESSDERALVLPLRNLFDYYRREVGLYIACWTHSGFGKTYLCARPELPGCEAYPYSTAELTFLGSS
ncbi:MAG: hypothetical protein KDD64_14655 [Bdellovibrionales bacterium]|nr:hypothetical protein [Bdellovibrionales bacterium]